VQPAELRKVVAANIRQRAKKRRVSLNALADLAGIARSPFYKALSGSASFTTDRLCKLANALGCEAHDLLRP